jgi:subtilase family serine protease
VARAVVGAVPLARWAANTRFIRPPTTTDCEAQLGIACYSPQQYQTAYNLAPLYQQGFLGAGRTIIIADAFGSPTIQHDLRVFDHAFGLPDPSLSILQPVGAIPPYNPNIDHMSGWALETTLVVEIAHAMAPDAAIVLLETPADETEGVVGMPQLMNATQLFLDAQGNRTAADKVWNDGGGAAGGGVSSVFARPSYQDGVATQVGTHRGIPDISLSADPNGGAILYQSFSAPAGFTIVGGTSQATPMMAGLVAIAAQIAGHSVGQINPTLYGLGAGGPGITDITSGNNSFNGVVGYKAVSGYDLASGLGSPSAADLVPRLAAGSDVPGPDPGTRPDRGPRPTGRRLASRCASMEAWPTPASTDLPQAAA